MILLVDLIDSPHYSLFVFLLLVHSSLSLSLILFVDLIDSLVDPPVDPRTSSLTDPITDSLTDLTIDSLLEPRLDTSLRESHLQGGDVNPTYANYCSISSNNFMSPHMTILSQ